MLSLLLGSGLMTERLFKNHGQGTYYKHFYIVVADFTLLLNTKLKLFLYNNFIGYVTIYTCIKKGYVREKLNSHKLTYPSTTLYKIQTIYIYTTTRQVILIYIQLIINL